jgi:hypothetical protein
MSSAIFSARVTTTGISACGRLLLMAVGSGFDRAFVANSGAAHNAALSAALCRLDNGFRNTIRSKLRELI